MMYCDEPVFVVKATSNSSYLVRLKSVIRRWEGSFDVYVKRNFVGSTNEVCLSETTVRRMVDAGVSWLAAKKLAETGVEFRRAWKAVYGLMFRPVEGYSVNNDAVDAGESWLRISDELATEFIHDMDMTFHYDMLDWAVFAVGRMSIGIVKRVDILRMYADNIAQAANCRL